MTLQSDHNIAKETADLFVTHEAAVYNKIDKKNTKVDALVDRMEKLEAFLNFVSNRTSDSHRLDLMTGEEQAIVDALREEGLEHIFPHGKYQWKEGEVEGLTRMINQHIEGPLQRQIHTLTEQMVLDQQELTKVLEIFRSIQTRIGNFIDRILANMARH